MVLSFFFSSVPLPSTHIRLDHLPSSASYDLQKEVKLFIYIFSFFLRYTITEIIVWNIWTF